MVIRPKNHNRMIVWYVSLALVLIGAISFVSYLLFDKIEGKGWEDIKTIIVASIVAYLSWIQLAYRFILDIILYTKKFKQAKKGVTQLIEVPSAYAPKQTKKVSQNIVKQDLKGMYVEKPIGDNLVRVSDKEIVIVYNKEFTSLEDYHKSISYTLGEIQEEIRKKQTGI